MNTPSILVTGANGLVGSALRATLIKRGCTVRAALSDQEKFSLSNCEMFGVPTIEAGVDCVDALQGMTTVIHPAARVHVMQDDANNPLEEFRTVNAVSYTHLILRIIPCV